MSTNGLKQYAKLRTLLDSLEVGALRYYLDEKAASRDERYYYLEGALRPIIDEIWHVLRKAQKPNLTLDCPPGYYDCEGLCVPYKCLGGLDGEATKPTTKKRKR